MTTALELARYLAGLDEADLRDILRGLLALAVPMRHDPHRQGEFVRLVAHAGLVDRLLAGDPPERAVASLLDGIADLSLPAYEADLPG